VSEKGGRLASIDALRGVAVLAVLLSHLPFSVSLAPSVGKTPVVTSFGESLAFILDHGRYGVHLFLVISGFCIHMQWARRKDAAASVDLLGFWKRRLRRLYPPYFVALAMTLAGLFVLYSISGGGAAGWWARFGYASQGQLLIDVFLLLLLMQNLNGASMRVGNAPFWTLALEEQLYMLYFPLLWLRRVWSWRAALIVCGVVTVGWRSLRPVLPEDLASPWLALGPSRWFEWALGAVAVEAYLGNITLPRVWSSLWFAGAWFGVALAVLDVPIVLGYPRILPIEDLLFGVAFFIVVNWAASQRLGATRATAWLAAVGVFSYSLYLTHEPVMVAAKQLGLRFGLGVAGTTVLRVLVPIACAWIFHRLVERKFMTASRPAPAPVLAPAAEG
jgi:peptidoglycan/LPS O-acetylase OafA/YrhL